MALPVGNRFIILRPDEFNTSTERLPVYQGKGRGFGSGGHETTRSCLEQLEKINLTEDSKVLDVGCGSGILSIVASLMGANPVIALDPDPNAISTAKSNIALNGLENSIFLFRGELSALKDKNYALIMANLYSDILLEIIKELDNMLAPGAILLLSGILYEYTYDIKIKTTAHHCEFIKAFYLEEYTTMLFRKISGY